MSKLDLTQLIRIGLIVILVTACDPERKNKCEWYLVPEPSNQSNVTPGLIPVCARNFVSNKQDCRYQTTFEYAKKVYGMTFRYPDLKATGTRSVRTIDQIRFCKP